MKKNFFFGYQLVFEFDQKETKSLQPKIKQNNLYSFSTFHPFYPFIEFFKTK